MGSVSIETAALATVTTSTTRGSVTIETAAPATVTHDETAGSLTIASAAPATVTVETTSSSIEITTQPPAVVTIDAESTPNVSLGQHDALDSLAHELAESCVTDYEYDGDGNITRVVTWASAARAVKVRERLFAYSGGLLATSTTTQHDAAGAVIATLAQAFTYDGDGNVTSKTTTRS